MVTKDTPRASFMQASNGSITVYSYDKEQDVYAPPFSLECYREFKVGASRDHYGDDPAYKALFILDGSLPYVTAQPNDPDAGFFTIKAGDKLLIGTDPRELALVLEEGISVYTVNEVREYIQPRTGLLLSVEVLCG